MSAAESSTWGDRLRGILPDFISEWWWPADPPAPANAEIPTDVPSSVAAAWLELPRAADNDYDFNWPLTTLTPTSDQTRQAAATASLGLLQSGQISLPLPAGRPVRLLVENNRRPDFLRQYLQQYGPLVEVSYHAEEHQRFTGLAHPGAVNVIFSHADDWTGDTKPALADLAELPAILLLVGHAAETLDLPSNWTVITCPTADRFAELALAERLFTPDTGRSSVLTYADPASVGFDARLLEKVDYQINRAIRRRATPGAQLLVAKDGRIVYNKSYGHHTYRRRQAVYTSDLYDLASVTKAAATSLAVMWLYDRQRIDLNKKVADYLPDLKKRPAGRYTLEQLLCHQTGLQADLPVHKYLGRTYVSDSLHGDFTIPLAEDRFVDASVPGRIESDLRRLHYTRQRIYRYSDVNYFILQRIIERIDGRPLDQLLREEIYGPLGLHRLGFRPFQRFKTEQVVPTAQEPWMRGGLVRAYVHDEGAALLGGVAGHAGLFATATDLAQLFQMLLNEGEYNGQRIFQPATVETFTTKSRYNYRALGFDRLAGGWPSVIRAGAGQATFGHTGFSGTCVWADPENDLVFVLLTNRIHPSPANQRFTKMNVRAKTLLGVYRALLPRED